MLELSCTCCRLQNSPATASIVTDSDEAILVCIEGSYLDGLFNSNPKLPGRFFAYLATYQATRLRNLTEMVSGDKREIMGRDLANVTIEDIFSNPAYMGIFRKVPPPLSPHPHSRWAPTSRYYEQYMSRAVEEDSEQRAKYQMSLLMFEFWMDVQGARACRSLSPLASFSSPSFPPPASFSFHHLIASIVWCLRRMLTCVTFRF